MSKKIEFKEHGGPEVLKYIDYELSSDKPSFNEIRIEHLSIGVNFIDIYHSDFNSFLNRANKQPSYYSNICTNNDCYCWFGSRFNLTTFYPCCTCC